MKQFFAYLLFIAFAIRPLFFVGQIAYYELNIEYITEKFCENKEKPQLQCNGKCHLAKQLKAIATENTTEDKEDSPSLIFEAFTPLFHQNLKETALQKKTVLEKDASVFYHTNNYKFSALNELLRPPIS